MAFRDKTYCLSARTCFFGDVCKDVLTAEVVAGAKVSADCLSTTEKLPCFIGVGEETARDIIKKYLLANEFDGLCCDVCNCRLDNILSCNSLFSRCRPGWLISGVIRRK